MSIIIKSPEEIAIMREGGKILAETLQYAKDLAKPGVSTFEIDKAAEEFIRTKGGLPSFKGYHGFPATICAGLNEVVVHGIPRANEILKEGDLLTIDCGVFYKGLHTDAAISFGIGEIDDKKKKLLKTAEIALSGAIDLAKPGIHTGELSQIIEKTIKRAGFHIIEELTGHGVGHSLHEDPIILNYFDGNPGPTLKEGMTLAIEPIFALGTKQIDTLPDNWTLITRDRSCAIQIEHTIVITQDGNEVLTQL